MIFKRKRVRRDVEISVMPARFRAQEVKFRVSRHIKGRVKQYVKKDLFGNFDTYNELVGLPAAGKRKRSGNKDPFAPLLNF